MNKKSLVTISVSIRNKHTHNTVKKLIKDTPFKYSDLVFIALQRMIDDGFIERLVTANKHGDSQ